MREIRRWAFWALVVVFAVAMAWQSDQGATFRDEARVALDSVAHLNRVRADLEVGVAALRDTVQTATLALDLAASRWDEDRRAAERRRLAARQESEALRSQLRGALTNPVQQDLLDSLQTAHDRETAALSVRIASLMEEAETLWMERTAMSNLIDRQDSLITIFRLGDEQRDAVITAQQSEIRSLRRGSNYLKAGVAVLVLFTLLR